MKFSTFAALTALCAVAESASALPFPSDYHGAAAAPELQARTPIKLPSFHRSSGTTASRPKSPTTPHALSPSSEHSTTGAPHNTAPSGLGSPSHSAPHSEQPSNQSGKQSGQQPHENPAQNPAAGSSQPKTRPSQSSQQATRPNASQTSLDVAPDTANTLAQATGADDSKTTAEQALDETKKQNQIVNKHNNVMKGLGAATFVGAAAFGVNSAVETDKKNKWDEQQAQEKGDQSTQDPAQQPANQTSQDTTQQPAPQTTQQPARRAIIDGEVYELYWVN